MSNGSEKIDFLDRKEMQSFWWTFAELWFTKLHQDRWDLVLKTSNEVCDQYFAIYLCWPAQKGRKIAVRHLNALDTDIAIKERLKRNMIATLAADTAGRYERPSQHCSNEYIQFTSKWSTGLNEKSEGKQTSIDHFNLKIWKYTVEKSQTLLARMKGYHNIVQMKYSPQKDLMQRKHDLSEWQQL